MLESIYVGMTGLLGYSRGLRVIANNTANINTPGFKGSSLQFADMFYSSGNLGGGSGDSGRVGFGLNTTGTTLNFRQGELRQTGNSLDMAVNGQGLFVLKDAQGNVHYTRAGQFEFNSDGLLVNRGDGSKVMGLGADGQLRDISLSGLQTNPGKATATIKFSGNLSSTAADQTVSVKVIDGVGGEHQLSLKLTTTGTATPGTWKVELLDGTTSVGTGQIEFANGKPTLASAKLSMNYSPTGQAAIPLALDFSNDVTSFASGNLSTLTATSQDGYSPGGLTSVSFDQVGALVLTYSNGQTVKGTRLALGRFNSLDAVGSVGDNQFEALDGRAWQIGGADAGGFGAIRAGVVEISNVDLSQEFSDLVVMQRGYQASSQVISTANEMLQQLYGMTSK
jgi:flagellar hook protein FlgE